MPIIHSVGLVNLLRKYFNHIKMNILKLNNGKVETRKDNGSLLHPTGAIMQRSFSQAFL
jgi:hypothetical protein